MRRLPEQMGLPLDNTLEPPATPESDAVYMAVMYLRTAGETVYRAGRMLHIVSGRFVSTYTLIRLGGSEWISSSSNRASKAAT